MRHAYVHEDDVGPVPPGGLDRLASVACFAYHLDARLGVEDHAEARTNQFLIVGYYDPHAHGRSAPSGSRTRPR